MIDTDEFYHTMHMLQLFAGACAAVGVIFVGASKGEAVANALAIQELKKTDLGPMYKEANKGLMVQWINADLLNRAGHDVRRSIVFLDEGRAFMPELGAVACVDPELWDALLAKPDEERKVTIDALYAYGARFWVRGLV